MYCSDSANPEESWCQRWKYFLPIIQVWLVFLFFVDTGFVIHCGNYTQQEADSIAPKVGKVAFYSHIYYRLTVCPFWLLKCIQSYIMWGHYTSFRFIKSCLSPSCGAGSGVIQVLQCTAVVLLRSVTGFCSWGPDFSATPGLCLPSSKAHQNFDLLNAWILVFVGGKIIQYSLALNSKMLGLK